ncbi:uncharacterized protein G2W53_014695 [Senna tora]|uniref:Uncharacterized protein n=1 Tax=Senna tora TaxID=362788 RepID=A0A834WU44_9FABA|nr:uncharacterized protein G2W53_014695 [Senna tora]
MGHSPLPCTTPACKPLHVAGMLGRMPSTP